MDDLQTLFTKIDEIQNKAERSEAMVQEICRDIRTLDYAKRNLTSSIKTLNQVKMLVSGLERLRVLSGKKQYKEVAELLGAVNVLSVELQRFNTIPKILSLQSEVKETRESLKRQIAEDIKYIDSTDNPANIKDACLVVDALGQAVRTEIIRGFTERSMNLYHSLFRKGREESSLEQINRRFNWLRKQIKKYTEKYEDVFPPYWSVPQEICTEFCLATRTAVAEYLQDHAPSMDVMVLLRALEDTLAFERELQKRFGTDPSQVAGYYGSGEYDYDEDDGQGRAGAEAKLDLSHLDLTTPEGIREKWRLLRERQEKDKAREERLKKRAERAEESKARAVVMPLAHYRFLGLVSAGFEDYLDAYVAFEDRSLGEMLQSGLAGETWEAVDERRQIVGTARDFVIYLDTCLSKTANLGSARTLFHLADTVWKKHARNYALAMGDHIPRPSPAPSSATAVKDSIMSSLTFGTMSSPSGPGAAEGEGVVVLALSERDEASVCAIINSAQYLIQNVHGLESKVQDIVDDEYKARVDFGVVVEDLQSVVSRGIKALVAGVMSQLEPSFNSMTRVPWAALDAVGDQSEYINSVIRILATALPNLATRLAPQHARFLFDKLVGSVLPAFSAALLRCKRVSETGAQQLLLDLQSLKAFLRVLPNSDKERLTEGALGSYQALVEKESAGAERILKFVATPTPHLADSYYEKSKVVKSAELARIMELKGLRRAEQQGVLDELQKKLGSGERKESDLETSSAMWKKFLLMN